MGLGKTLTSLAVIWAFVRNGACKAVVVCPSSLIDNWLKEIKMWMGTKLANILCIKSGIDAAVPVSNFTTGHYSKFPLLVVSYEVSNLLYDDT